MIFNVHDGEFTTCLVLFGVVLKKEIDKAMGWLFNSKELSFSPTIDTRCSPCF